MSKVTTNSDDSVLVLVDIQGKLAKLMAQREELYAQLGRLIRGALLFDMPIIWMEQIPDKIGPTIAEVASLLPNQQPIPKNTFSCYGEPAFVTALEATGRRHVILAGIESHVCVYQTCIHLIENKYSVTTVNDAISSRTPANRILGLERMQMAGAQPSSVEMLLFEMQVVAEGDRFRSMAKLFKD
jgi:nicotinamidase-related amidase